MNRRLTLACAARHQTGQVATEYLLVLGVLALAWGLGAGKPIEQVVGALHAQYQRFAWAMSLP
jgi:hypothetical protein